MAANRPLPIRTMRRNVLAELYASAMQGSVSAAKVFLSETKATKKTLWDQLQKGNASLFGNPEDWPRYTVARPSTGAGSQNRPNNGRTKNHEEEDFQEDPADQEAAFQAILETAQSDAELLTKLRAYLPDDEEA